MLEMSLLLLFINSVDLRVKGPTPDQEVKIPAQFR